MPAFLGFPISIFLSSSTTMSAAAYERQWLVGPKPKDPTPPIPDVANTRIQQPATPPTVPPKPAKPAKQFIPALPRNPRPVRRPSQDIKDGPHDLQTSPRSRAGSNAAQAEPIGLPSILKSPKIARSLSIKTITRPPPLKLSSPEPRIDSNTSSSPSPKDAPSPVPQIRKIVESPQPSPPDAQTPNLKSSDAIFLRVVDIPPSQRSSDTMPVGYDSELASNETTDAALSVSPVNITPSGLIQSFESALPPSPPSVGDISEPRTPLSPLVEIQPDLQPAPLKFKPQVPAKDSIAGTAPPTPPQRTSPPPEAALPPIPEPNSMQLAQQAHKRSLSVKFKPQVSLDAPLRRTSSLSNTSLASLAPRSLATYLLELGNTPRKLYLATHSPFLRAVSTSKANTALMSDYLAQ